MNLKWYNKINLTGKQNQGDECVQIEYRNSRLAKICTSIYAAEKKYGREMAEKIHLRIKQILASPGVEMLIQYRIGRCHELKGKRKKQYAMDLVHPYRLIFERRGTEIQIAYIMEIVDYH